jgi:Flp pilus assembly protein TadG
VTVAKRSARKGSTAIEFALIAPILLALLTGIMDYSWYMSQRSAVVFATQDGARAAVMEGFYGSPIDAAEARVAASLEAAGVKGTPTVQVAIVAIGEPVTITTTVAFDELVGLVPAPPILFATSTMLLDH